MKAVVTQDKGGVFATRRRSETQGGGRYHSPPGSAVHEIPTAIRLSIMAWAATCVYDQTMRPVSRPDGWR